MKQFTRLDQYATDELILIITDERELWQSEAVEYAKQILLKRGISDDYSKKRIIELRKKENEFWLNELKRRRNESFGVIPLILMIIFWPKYIFRDWQLNKEGYSKKRKERLYAIGFGIMLYSIYLINFSVSYDKKRIEDSNNQAINDSLAKSKIDWSGKYIFYDTTEKLENELIWELKLKKEKLDHKGELKITNKDSTIIIFCVGLIKDNELEIYPDTTYEIFGRLNVSYYDRLFRFTKFENEIMTIWDNLSPFYHNKYNNTGLFKKI